MASQSSLPQAIAVVSWVKQLSKHDFLQFMDKMFDFGYSDLIAISLFKHFMKSPIYSNDINSISSMLSNVIQSRNTNPETPDTNIQSFDELPKELIGYTASFLDQENYFRLQQINRSVFIGCNTPNMLQKLDLIDIKNYSSINLSQFRSLKQLKININQFHQFPLPNNGQFIMNKLQELHLNANKTIQDYDITPFIKQDCINIKNIKNLHFVNRRDRIPYGHNTTFLNIETFWLLFIAFHNVEYLTIELPGERDFSRDENCVKRLVDLHPNLKGLAFCTADSRMNNDLVNVFGNNLQFLHGSFVHTNNNIDFSGINFSKLQHVFLKLPTAQLINQILKTGKNNIRKFGINPMSTCIYASSSSIKPEELKTIIPQMLNCKSLQYFEIWVNDEIWRAALEGIESGLYKVERKQISIRVNGTSYARINLKSRMNDILRIIRWLDTLKINDFMFICDMTRINPDFKKYINKDEILAELNDISPTVKAICPNGLCFIITNTNCKICGWKESWAFPSLE